MAVSAASASYQVRIATAGASTVSGNVAVTLALADIDDVPLMSGATVDPLTMTVVRQPFPVRCITDDVLFTSSGRMNVLGRLIDVQRSLDGGAFATIGTGRISAASEPEGRGMVELEVSDETWSGKSEKLFQTTTTVQLYPVGLTEAWADMAAKGVETFNVLRVSGDAVHIAPDNEDGIASIEPAPVALREALARDIKSSVSLSASNSAGNFTDLRFNAASGTTTGDHTVIVLRNNISGFLGTSQSGILGTLSPESSVGYLDNAWIYISGHSLSASDQITGKFYFPTGCAISEAVPMHVGGSAGIHPGTLLKNELDGDYGGVVKGYDSTAMTAIEALDLRPVWVRATESADRDDWRRENIYKPFGIAPLVGTDLQVRPTALRLDQNVNPSTLPVLDVTNVTGLTWRHTSSNLRNVVSVATRSVSRSGPGSFQTPGTPADGYNEPVPVEYDNIDHDNVVELGDNVYRLETSIFLERPPFGYNSAGVQALADAVFDIFGDGAQGGSVTVAEDEGLEVGDQVVIDCDSLKMFNAGDGARTGKRTVRLIAFRDVSFAAREFDFLDLGPDSTPLSAPTVVVAQDGSDDDLFNVTISGLAAGTYARVECDYDPTATAPDPYRYVLSQVGNGTVGFTITDAGTGYIHARAYAYAPGRVRSAWATDNDTITTRALITAASLRWIGRRGVVSWETLSTTLGVRTRYDVHDIGSLPTFANQTDYDADDAGFSMLASPGQMISVELTPYTGWSDPNVSGSAGPIVEVQEADPRVIRGSWDVDNEITTPEISFNSRGEAVVSAVGGKDVVQMFVTVGDGSAPSDPTSGTNDGVITGKSGTVSTGVKITTGNEAFVKVLGADSGGNISEVVSAKMARRLGSFHLDGTDRSTSGAVITTLETVTVPAGALGENGAVRFRALVKFTGIGGTKTVLVSWGPTTYQSVVPASTYQRRGFIDFTLFNAGATDRQELSLLYYDETPTVEIDHDEATKDTTSDVDIVISGECVDASDTITMLWSSAELLGTA